MTTPQQTDRMKALLVIVGDEITTGTVSDTNGGWLARHLTEVGFEIEGFLFVRDRMNEIVQALDRATTAGKLVVVTGGLGPTTDDITRDAIARFLQVPLLEHAPSLKKIEERYRLRGIPMNPISKRQALFPEGANILNNSAGTADAFIVQKNAVIVSLPGVPREMHALYREEVLPRLKELFPALREPVTGFLRTFGLSESAVGSAVESSSIVGRYHVGYRPVFPETFVKFVSEGGNVQELEEDLKRVIGTIGQEFLVSRSESVTLAQVVLQSLKERGLSVAFAESCSAGLLSDLLVSEAGSSQVFRGGIVCYSNEMKEALLEVPSEILEQHGAVSAEVARELARNVRTKMGSSIGVSITGVAGPDGGTEAKPVGTVFFGYSRENREEVVQHFLPFDRNRIRRYSAFIGLDMIRRDLFNLPLKFERR